MRRQAEKPGNAGDLTKILVGGIVTGIALAIGGEAWAWISPMKRRERTAELDDSDFDVDFEEVDG